MLQFTAKTRDKKVNFTRLASIKNGACYSSVRIFNKLPPQIVQLRDDKLAFRNIKKNSHNKGLLLSK
jgi:hypothetical protein